MGSGESSCPLAAIGAGGTTSQFAVIIRAAGWCLLPGVYGLDRPPGSACLVVSSPRRAATEGTKVMGLVEMIDLMVTRRIASILLMYQVDFCPAHDNIAGGTEVYLVLLRLEALSSPKTNETASQLTMKDFDPPLRR